MEYTDGVDRDVFRMAALRHALAIPGRDEAVYLRKRALPVVEELRDMADGCPEAWFLTRSVLDAARFNAEFADDDESFGTSLERCLLPPDREASAVLSAIAGKASEELRSAGFGENSGAAVLARAVSLAAADGDPSVDADDALALSAFRYCIGRMTYVVGCCVRVLAMNWETLSPPTRETIAATVRDRVAQGMAGHDMDARLWSGLPGVGEAPVPALPSAF